MTRDRRHIHMLNHLRTHALKHSRAPTNSERLHAHTNLFTHNGAGERRAAGQGCPAATMSTTARTVARRRKARKAPQQQRDPRKMDRDDKSRNTRIARAAGPANPRRPQQRQIPEEPRRQAEGSINLAL